MYRNIFTCLYLLARTTAFSAEDVPRQSTVFLDSVPWGSACAINSTLFLHVEQVPINGEITIPRLNNPVKSICFQGMPQEILKLSPHVHNWTIQIPETRRRDAPQTIVLQLEGEPYLPVQPQVLEADSNGTIQLSAHNSVTHGKSLRYEPQPQKNTVGYWTNVKDWAQWHFRLSKSAKYRVVVRYGCGSGQGGSTVALNCGQQSLQWTVESTGGFQKWRDMHAGFIELKNPGRYTLEIRSIKIFKDAVMDVQCVTMTPIESTSVILKPN